uniref:C2H2-type domain-containing protein n=1 Tax=Macrostomum lignano TaxID=282301 RepID=A0A1I8FEU7_9PLAT
MANTPSCLRCHLCDGVNLFNHHIKLIQHMHYLHGFSDTGTHPCEACPARSSTRSTDCGSTFTMYTQSMRASAATTSSASTCCWQPHGRGAQGAAAGRPLSAAASKSVAAEVWDEISCEMCKKVFSSERLLAVAVHRQRVHGQTSESRCFPCPHCQASLKGKQNLLKPHQADPRVRLKDLKVDCHDPASDAYQCGVCTLSFRMQHLLLQHRRASHPQLTCHNCGRIFDNLLICSASGGGGADGERKRKRKAAAAAAAAAAASTTGEGGIGGGGPGSTQAQPPGFKAPLPVADADPAAGPAGGSGAAV